MKLIPTKTQFNNWSLPSKLTYVAVLIAIIAIILAITIFIVQLLIGASKAGQEKTHDKLETIDDKLIEEQRPHLQLNPAVKDGIALQCEQGNNKVFFVLNINMKNTGKTPARSIVCVRDSVKLVAPGIEYDAGDSESPTVASSLSPGQDFNLRRRIWASSSDSDKLNDLIRAWEEGHVYTNVDVALTYKGTLPDNEYSVSALYKITKQTDFILDYKSD